MDSHLLRERVRGLKTRGYEDGDVEAKAAVGGLPKSTWETVSAFANTGGGILLLGIDESAGFIPAPGFDHQRILDAFTEGMGDGGGPSRLTNPPGYDVTTLDLDGGSILAIEIQENSPGTKPCFITERALPKGAYKRIGDHDTSLNALEVFELQHLLNPSTADDELISDTDGDDLALELIDPYLAAQADTRHLRDVIHDREAALRRLGVLGKSGHVRMAALLTMGRYPQQFYPQLFIDVAVHPGTQKSAPGQQVRFLDRVLCEGPLADAVGDAVSAVARNLRTVSIVQGSERMEHLEIPREVLREAITNAVTHREYSERFRGQPVSVDVYTDRVEITSPGGLWGGKTVATLADGQSRCRNSRLMQILRHLPISRGTGSVAEGNGGGVAFMRRAMAENALPEPHFDAQLDHVRVILGRHGLEYPARQEWLLRHLPEGAQTTDRLIMLQVHELGSVDVPTLRDVLGRDSDQIREHLSALTEADLLQRSGDVWRLPSNVSAQSPQDHRGRSQSSTVDAEILKLLALHGELSVQDLATSMERSVSHLRARLRDLVACGTVQATAPPTSRKRRYRLP